MHEESIKRMIEESISAHSVAQVLIPSIQTAVHVLIDSLQNGGKILICGNGGSAAEAQHFSSELIGKFEKDRRALAAIALTTDGSNITAVGNDTDFAFVFSRQVEALGKKEDVLVCLTTSDYNEIDNHSMNLKNALLKAREQRMKTILIGSVKSEKISELVDVAIQVKSEKTARIQEVHLLIIHILTKLIEDRF